jgi:Transposase DDE domain
MKTVSPVLTPLQDQQLGEIETHIQSLFHEKAEQWARSTGFVQRASKINGSAFAQTLVFGFLNQPEASYTDLQQTMQLQGVEVSAQAIEERMTPQAAALMGRLLEEMVAMVVSGQQCHLPILQSFDGVYLQDGTVLTLPDELRDHWRGSGETGGEAGLRVQLRINWSDGKLTGPWLQDARASENTGEATVEQSPLPKGALYLADSGYLILKRMRELDAQGDFWLTPARANLIITDQQGIRRDLPSFVASRPAGAIDEWVWVGAERQLFCRLLVFADEEKARPPKKDQKTRVKGSRHDVQVGRHKRAKGSKGRKRVQTSPQHRRLKGALVLLTNVPTSRLSPSQARTLLRLRWQIELIWKMWKQYGKLDCWRSEKGMRILCEVYAKLMAMILQHWFTIAGCWSDPHRSLVKACHLVQKMAPCLLLTMHGPLTQQALFQIICCSMKGCTLNPRKKRPNTSQRLFADSS